MKHTYFRLDIEGLRAFAILLVIASHIDLGYEIFPGGYIGVDVFFTLSGFLITNLLITEYEINANNHNGYGWVSLPAFYFRRARRLIPGAIFVLTITTIYAQVSFNHERAMSVLRDGVYAFFFTANWHMIQLETDYFQRGFEQSPFEHFWSLSVEEQFYLIVPCLFLMTVYMHGLRIGKLKLSWNRRILILMSSVVISSFVYSVFLVSVSPTSAYFSSLTRAWEIGVGGLLSLFLLRHKFSIQKWAWNLISISGFVSIAIASIFFNANTRFPGLNALVPVLSVAGIITAGSAHQANLVSKFLSQKVFTSIGRISYSVYLWYLPILVYGRHYFPNKNQLVPRELFLCGVIFLAGFISYRFVEKPFRNISLPASLATQPRRRMHSNFSLKTLAKNSSAINVSLISLLGVSIAAYWLAPLDRGIIAKNHERRIDSSIIISNKLPNAVMKSPSVNLSTKNESNIKKSLISSLGIADLEEFHSGLELLLRDSLIDRSLPTSLIPTMSQLAMRKGFQPELCSKNFCKFGNGPKVITIIGNSFAQMIQPIVTNALPMDEYTVRLQWKSGCQIAELDKCADIFKVPPDTDFIIVSEYSYGHPGFSNLEIKKGLEFNYRNIAALNKPVIIFGQPVFRLTTLLDCIGSNNLITAKCNTAADSVKDINDLKKEIALANEFLWVDPNDWICSDNNCPLVVGEYVVSVDNQHLAFEFSKKFLAPEFRLFWLRLGIK